MPLWILRLLCFSLRNCRGISACGRMAERNKFCCCILPYCLLPPQAHCVPSALAVRSEHARLTLARDDLEAGNTAVSCLQECAFTHVMASCNARATGHLLAPENSISALLACQVRYGTWVLYQQSRLAYPIWPPGPMSDLNGLSVTRRRVDSTTVQPPTCSSCCSMHTHRN